MTSSSKPNESSDWPFEHILRVFDAAGVKHLVVGGQAAVAYGVSQFTQDADLWVEPTQRNLGRLRRALDTLQARPRFLPPLELRHLRRGHGIHFTVPHGAQTYYLDLLGQPPRVGSFAAAYRDAMTVEWRGLQVRLLDVRRLVQTKKTNRDQDYVVIQRLADLIFQQVKRDRNQRIGSMEWLLRELRTARHLKTVAREWGATEAIIRRIARPTATLAASDSSLAEIQAALDKEKASFQQANLDYWKPLLQELRSIRQQTIRENRHAK